MTNNDILRRLRYALELDNLTLLACLHEAGVELAPERLASMLKNDDEPGFELLDDELLGLLLDGFVTKRRGKREPQPGAAVDSSLARVVSDPPATLSNNRILRAIKIGLELKDVDILAIMELATTPLSKTELSALFRREDHRNYQPCGDQFLRNFLKGLGVWHRSPAGQRRR